MVYLVTESMILGTNISILINTIAKKNKYLDNKSNASQKNMIKQNNPKNDDSSNKK